MPLYIEYGLLLSFINIALIALCIVLLLKKITPETSKRILLYPCLIFVIFCGILIYSYLSDLFIAYYSGAKYELEAHKLRIEGPYAWHYRMYLLGITLPLFLILPKYRSVPKIVLIIASTSLALRLFDYFPITLN